MNRDSRAVAVIDKSIIKNNMKNIYEKVKSTGSTKIMGVLKANSYGLGALEIAETIDEYCDFFALASFDEAYNLRQNNIKKPLLVLGHMFEEDYMAVITEEIRPTIFDFDTAEKFSKIAKLLNKTCKIHIKIDTGMNRIGFMPNDENIEIIKSIQNLPSIEIEGIFSHFARADYSDKSHTLNQLDIFNNYCKKLEENKVILPIKHIANSGAIMDLKETYLDMVRPGIIIYGYYPSDEVIKSNLQIEPALTIKSKIVNLKIVEAGQNVSYSEVFKTQKPTKIATVSMGYADGFPRQTILRASALVNGKKVQIVGLCMDQIMLDVSEVDDVKIYDDVVFIGKSGDLEITVEDVARLRGTVNYEIICNMSDRLKRIYI